MWILFLFFILPLLGIVLLFFVKSLEIRTGKVLFAAQMRERCNMHIVRYERYIAEHCTFAAVYAFLKRVLHRGAHMFARMTANIAKKVEWRARSVAHRSAKATQAHEAVRENVFLSDVQKHKESLNREKVAEEAKL